MFLLRNNRQNGQVQQPIGQPVDLSEPLPPPPEPDVFSVGINVSALFRLFLLDMRSILSIPVKIAQVMWAVFVWILYNIYPVLLILLFIWIFWYLIYVYWPYMMLLVVNIAIPVLNVLILIANFAIVVFLIILRVLILVWDILVPFLGMLLYVVVNVFLTILADIFNIIGSINWEPIVTALMKLLTILVDIAMQILMVIIKVGEPILEALAQVIGVLVEIIFTFVKILVEVLTWIFQLLFQILEPILQIVGDFFSALTGIFAVRQKLSFSTARKLLSLSLAVTLLNTTGIPIAPNGEKEQTTLLDEEYNLEDYEDYEKFIRDTLHPRLGDTDDYMKTVYYRYEKSKSTRLLTDDFHLYNNETGEPLYTKKSTPTPASSSLNDFAKSPLGRHLLEWDRMPTNNGLRFVGEHEDDHEDQNENGAKYAKPLHPDSSLDDYAHTMAHTMKQGAGRMSLDDLTLAKHTMKRIRHEHHSKDKLGIRSILQEFAKKHSNIIPAHEETLAAVRFSGTLEHPRDMHVRFHKEREQKARTFVNSNTGRKLMSAGASAENWHSAKQKYMSDLEVKHARAIIEQQNRYKEHHETRMKVATVVYSAATRALKQTFETAITPQTILNHWDATLDFAGYDNLWHARDDFLERYGDATTYLASFSSMGEHPVFKYFKEKDETRHESPYFHDWITEQKKAEHARRNKEENDGGGGGRRHLMQAQNNQDSNIGGTTSSKGALSGLPTLSTLNCFSVPKNPLCVPQIPWNFTFAIPEIRLTQKQKETLEGNIALCSPWEVTLCLVCYKTLINAIVEVLFLIGTIPLINYPIATLTIVAPWTNPFFGWIFIVVPRFHIGTLFQFVCFAYHLYDLFVIGLLGYLFAKLVWPFLVVFWEVLGSFRDNKIEPGLSWFEQRRLKAMEKYWQQVRAQARTNARIGSSLNIGGSRSRRQRPRRHQTDTDDDSSDFSFSSSASSSSSDSESNNTSIRERRRRRRHHHHNSVVVHNNNLHQHHHHHHSHEPPPHLRPDVAVVRRHYRQLGSTHALLQHINRYDYHLDPNNYDEHHVARIQQELSDHPLHTPITYSSTRAPPPPSTGVNTTISPIGTNRLHSSSNVTSAPPPPPPADKELRFRVF